MVDPQRISPLRAWILAIRPQTLLAAIAPGVVGTGLAGHDSHLSQTQKEEKHNFMSVPIFYSFFAQYGRYRLFCTDGCG